MPKRFFDVIAPLYDTLIKGPPPKNLLEILKVKENEKILEIGAGTGRAIQDIIKITNNIWILDPSIHMLNQATKKYPKVKTVISKAEKTPFKDESFDRIFAIDSLHHWDDAEQGLKEANRILKNSEGLIIIIEFDPLTMFGHFIKSMEKVLQMGSTFYSPREMRKLMRKTNFRIKEQYKLDEALYSTIAERY